MQASFQQNPGQPDPSVVVSLGPLNSQTLEAEGGAEGGLTLHVHFLLYRVYFRPILRSPRSQK